MKIFQRLNGCDTNTHIEAHNFVATIKFTCQFNNKFIYILPPKKIIVSKSSVNTFTFDIYSENPIQIHSIASQSLLRNSLRFLGAPLHNTTERECILALLQATYISRKTRARSAEIPDAFGIF